MMNFELRQYNHKIIFLLSIIFIVLLFFLDLIIGSVDIPLKEIFKILTFNTSANSTWQTILLDIRLPRTITALFTGVGLALSGLLMQILFRNPLAGPFVLGITSGGSLGAALSIMLLGTGIFSFLNVVGIAASAVIGSLSILFLILLISVRIKDNVALLICGLMFSYMIGALVSVLQFFTSAASLQGFVLWGLGSFTNTGWTEIILLGITITLGTFISFFLSKSVNAIQLGENYALSLGVNIKRQRFIIIIITGLMTGIITAFCGPIAFIGIAVPHLCRLLIRTADHKILIPFVAICGAILAIFCDIIAQLPGSEYVLPINAITSIIGAPVVIWLIIRQRNFQLS